MNNSVYNPTLHNFSLKDLQEQAELARALFFLPKQHGRHMHHVEDVTRPLQLLWVGRCVSGAMTSSDLEIKSWEEKPGYEAMGEKTSLCTCTRWQLGLSKGSGMRPIVLRSHLLENCDDVFVKFFFVKREGDESSCFSNLMRRRPIQFHFAWCCKGFASFLGCMEVRLSTLASRLVPV